MLSGDLLKFIIKIKLAFKYITVLKYSGVCIIYIFSFVASWSCFPWLQETFFQRKIKRKHNDCFFAVRYRIYLIPSAPNIIFHHLQGEINSISHLNKQLFSVSHIQ